MKFLNHIICLSQQPDSFGPKRRCFVSEKPDEDKAKSKKVDLSSVGSEVSEEESKEALDALKVNKEKRKEVVAGAKDELTELRIQLEKKKEEDAKKKTEEKEKEKPKLSEAEKEKLKDGPRIPERAKDAPNGSQLMDAFKQCKSLEERQTLILDQLAKGNVPDSFRTFQKVKVEQNGKTMEFLAAPSGLRLGTDTDSIEFPMNGPLAQAVADATGCELPTKWMVDQLSEEGKKNGQFIPFAPQVFSKEDAARMRSPDFIQTHDNKYKKWATDHGIDLTKPFFGYFKHVVQQSPEQRAKAHAGGNLDIYGGIYTNGNTVEPGGVNHDIYHDDYSQNVQLIARTVYIDGKPMKLADVLADSDLAGSFGFPVQPRENRYAMPAWMQQKVAAIQQLAPGPSGVVETVAPAPVFEGIAQEKLDKGKVTAEYDYTLTHGAPGGHVKFVKTEEGEIAVMEYQGTDHQVKVDAQNESKVNSTKGYEPSSLPIARPFGYVLLKYFGAHGYKIGDIIPFEYKGKQYLAQYQIHPADASAPTDHQGVGILMKSDGGTVSEIPKPGTLGISLGGPGTPNPEAPQPITGDFVPAPRKGGGAPKAGPSYGGGGVSYGGGAPSGGVSYATYAPSPVPGGPAPTPTYAPTPTPSEGYKPKPAPSERKEAGEYIIRGNTLFLGDSNSVGAFNRANINVDGNIHSIAKGSMDADWVLTQLKDFENTGELKNFKNMVVTVGVNGIGKGAGAIFNTLKQIWEIGKKYNIKVFAGTLAPFKGWSNFGASYEKYNGIRKEVNRMIRESQAKDGIPDGIIPYDELAADPNDPDQLGPGYDGGDHLHIPKLANAKLVASILGEPVKKEGAESPEAPVEAKEGSGDLTDFEQSPYFNEKIKTYNFPEGDPDPLRVHINVPGNYDKKKPSRVVVFALPAGNTIEQTIGAKKKEGQDWHYEIQQIAAQTRKLRETSPEENIVIAYVEAPKLNPPAWHKDQAGRGQIFGQLAEDVKSKIGAPNATIDISSHSAGRNLVGSYIDENPEIPNDVKRLSYLDSNHSFNAARSEKMIAWLKTAQDHYLTVISYDDRNVMLDGKPVPGAVGYARTLEMVEQFQKQGVDLTKEQKNGYIHYTGLKGQVNILIMDNPANKILHTETVFRNGFIYGETAGSPLDGKAGQFNTPITFGQYIQDESPNLEISKKQNPEAPAAPASPEVTQLDEVPYTINQGAPGGTLRLFSNGEAKMTFQDKAYDMKVDPNYVTPDLAKPPEGYQIHTNPSLMAAVMDFAMLHTMLKMKKPQGTEMPFEYNGTQYIAKLAWHTDHPGADLYIKK